MSKATPMKMRKNNEKTWQRNAPSQIILNSIFAALDGILIPLAFTSLQFPYAYIVIALLVCSFFLFAISAEQTLNALDEKDVKKYIYYMFWYNLGVIFLGLSIATAVYVYFFAKASWYVVIGYFMAFCFVFLHRWFKDSYWLLRKRKADFLEYFDELEDRVKPEPETPIFMRCFYKCKGIEYGDELPHYGVFTRIGISKIHGVGVFAIQDIPKGTNLFENDNSQMVWIDKSEVANLDPALKKLYDDFAVIKNDQYGCPVSFNSLTVGWYINESKNSPNVGCTPSYDFIALREIKSGEELLVNYADYSEEP